LNDNEGRGEEEREPGNEVAPTREDVTHVSALPLKIRISEQAQKKFDNSCKKG